MMMNFLDLSAASEEECRLIKEILADTSVVNIADPIESKLSATTAATNSSSPALNSPQPAAPKYAPASSNHIVPVTATQNQNFRNNNYNGQRKGAHNSGNISNSSSSSNRNRIPSMSNVSSGSSQNHTNVQFIYPQQYTPPPPSTNPYHNININNINSHSSNAIQSQLSHQRANEHGNERLRTIRNHMHSNNNNNSSSNNNNNVNIVSTSSSVTPNIGPTIDQHHGNSMPLNMYNQHPAHMHHQVPSAMPAPKMDNKHSGSKNPSYHVQENPNNLQNTTSGGQTSTTSGQMPQMAGDMNSVIGIDMTAHPQGYAIQAFAPPHPHQMFSGPPIFQPHPYSYLIPYNLPPYVPYVPMAPNTVPPRPQIQPHTSQTSSNVAINSSHSRHNNSITQPLNNDHSDPGPTTIRNSNSQQSKLENSQASDSDRIQDRALTAQDSRPVANARSTPSRSGTEIRNSFENLSLGSQIQFNTHQERPNKMLQSNKSATSTKVSPPAGRNKDALPTRGDHLGSKADNDTHVLVANGQLTSEITQSLESTAALATSTSSPSDDRKASKADNEPTADVQSSPEVSPKEPEFSNRSTKNTTRKPQSDGCNKISPEKVSSDPNDFGDTETTQKSTGQSVSSKSWASLFKGKGSNVAQSHGLETESSSQWIENSDEESTAHKSSVNIGSTVTSNSTASTKEQRSQDIAKRALDKTAYKIAMRVNTINLKHALPFLKPRGFINKGNGCYINATLQALIACPPFYNLMKEIGDLRLFRRENSCTPILDSFAELFLHFPPPDLGKKIKQATPADSKQGISSLQAEAIEPKCIYNVLGNIKPECVRGAQEDAEEFLSFVLNGLHEEMITLGEVLHESNGQNSLPSDVEDSNDDNTNDDNLWREVGSKNRSLPIRIAKVVNTPIQEIFGGSLFSIRTAGKDRCAHRSPFFDLQLDISGDNVKSVQDAIKSFTSPEIINDFFCSKTKQKLDAQRKTSLDQLPPILILHLKQFIYTKDCGLKKLMKKIDYPIDFELPESCLHEKNSADKNLLTSRSYKLLAVVYHDGKEAVKGHYLTDVYHIGSSQWIRCDDSNLKAISSPRIENPDAPRTPYLLFYRRLNTLRAQSNNHDSKKKN